MASRVARVGAVALLRGINIGGHHKVKMDALRAMYEALGFSNVSTYIQSGNVVFAALPKQLDAQRIEAAFEKQFGFASATILRTASEIRDVVEQNPFAGRDLNPAKLAVSFLTVAADPAIAAKALDGYDGPEEIVAQNRELYLYYPDGMGRSKLPVARLAKALGCPGTARNWNTVAKLLELAQQVER